MPDEKIFWENVSRRFAAGVLQKQHARKIGISNKAKSMYYQSALMLIGTVVEALAHRLVKKHTTAPGHIMGEEKKYDWFCNLPKSSFGSLGDLVVCKRLKVPVTINDKGVGFADYNNFLKNHNHITPKEYKVLDKIRVYRNKIHVQGIPKRDIGHTVTLTRTFNTAVLFLIQKIRATP